MLRERKWLCCCCPVSLNRQSYVGPSYAGLGAAALCQHVVHDHGMAAVRPSPHGLMARHIRQVQQRYQALMAIQHAGTMVEGLHDVTCNLGLVGVKQAYAANVANVL